MALMNNALPSNIEKTQGNLLPAKTFQASNANHEFKKRTFSDVTNTLTKKSTNQIGKPKLTQKDQTKGPFSFSIYNEKSKNCQSSKNQSEQNIASMNKVSVVKVEDVDDENITTCTCSDSDEDDFAGDFLFKNIRLAKHKIENLALNWENTPVCSVADMRKIEVPLDPIVDDGGEWDQPLVEDEFDFDLIDLPPVHSDFDNSFGL